MNVLVLGINNEIDFKCGLYGKFGFFFDLEFVFFLVVKVVIGGELGMKIIFINVIFFYFFCLDYWIFKNVFFIIIFG